MPLVVLLTLALSASVPDAGVGEAFFPGAEADRALVAKLDQALALRRASRHQEALDLLKATRLQALEEKHLEIATRALHRQAQILAVLHRTSEAEYALRQAYAEAEAWGNLWAMGAAAGELGPILRGEARLDWLQRSLDAWRKAKDADGLCSAAMALADATCRDRRAQEAVPLYEEAVRAAESLPDPDLRWRTALDASLALLAEADMRRDPVVLSGGRALLSRAIAAYDAAGHGRDLPSLCSKGKRQEAQRQCEKNWPLDTPLSRWVVHQREADGLSKKAKRASNGFAATPLLFETARAYLAVAADLRLLGTERAAEAAEAERQARTFLLHGLANRDAATPLVGQCAVQDVGDLCERCAVVRKP